MTLSADVLKAVVDELDAAVRSDTLKSVKAEHITSAYDKLAGAGGFISPAVIDPDIASPTPGVTHELQPGHEAKLKAATDHGASVKAAKELGEDELKVAVERAKPKAREAFKLANDIDKEVVNLVGHDGKGGQLRQIEEEVRKRVRAGKLLPEDGGKIINHLKDSVTKEAEELAKGATAVTENIRKTVTEATTHQPAIVDRAALVAGTETAGTVATNVAKGIKTESSYVYKAIADNRTISQAEYEGMGFGAKYIVAPAKSIIKNEGWAGKGARTAVTLVGIYPVYKGLESLGQWTGIVSAGVDPQTQQPIQPDAGTAIKGVGLTALGAAIITGAWTLGGAAKQFVR